MKNSERENEAGQPVRCSAWLGVRQKLWPYMNERVEAEIEAAWQSPYVNPKAEHPGVTRIRQHVEGYDEEGLIFPRSIQRWRRVKAEVMAMLAPPNDPSSATRRTGAENNPKPYGTT